MRKTTVTCDSCGKEVDQSNISDFFTLIRKRHYMIPIYDSDKHFCDGACLLKYCEVFKK